MYVECVLSGDYAEIIPRITKCEAKIASYGAVNSFIILTTNDEDTSEKYETLYFLKAFKLILTKKPKLVIAKSLHSKIMDISENVPSLVKMPYDMLFINEVFSLKNGAHVLGIVVYDDLIFGYDLLEQIKDESPQNFLNYFACIYHMQKDKFADWEKTPTNNNSRIRLSYISITNESCVFVNISIDSIVKQSNGEMNEVLSLCVNSMRLTEDPNVSKRICADGNDIPVMYLGD